MKIEAIIKSAMARLIESRFNIESVVVTRWEEEHDPGGYRGCDTCDYGASPESYYVYIWYTYSGAPQERYFAYDGSFAELIKELDHFSE